MNSVAKNSTKEGTIKIWKYAIDGSTLDLASVANAKPIPLTVYTDDTFDNIQKKVEYKTGVPPKEQLLSIDGQPVEDDDIPNNGIVVCQLVNH